MKVQEVIFLRGFPRSGTNWLCHILNLHPDIYCTGEFHLDHLFTAIKTFRKVQHSCINKTEQEYLQLEAEFHRFIQRSVARYGSSDHRIVCDRTANSVAATFIPESKYLIISRDGRDCLVSWFYHTLRLQMPRVMERFPEMAVKANQLKINANHFEEVPHLLLDCEGFFRERARQWCTRILEDKEICTRIDSGLLKAKYYWISYERLHSEPEKYRQEVYEFLGLDGSIAARLNPLTTPGFKKHNAMAHNRKGAVGNWRKYFTPEMAQWFDEEASEALDSLSYERSTTQLQT